jgi:protein-S-isoprenylcysteine O-methyltransferase
MGLVGLVLQGCGFGLTWSVRRPPEAPVLDAPFPVLVFLSGLAVALAFASALLTLWSVRTLGKQWALAARLVEGHELVTSGPYRYVRNPIYSGMLGMLVATGIAVSRPWGLLLGVLFFWVGTVVRVRAEERLLRDAFGQTWIEWSQRTAALVPGLW